MNKPLVSIIILNYNGGIVTENCLKSVLKSQYFNFEIILVDNASFIDEVKKLKKFKAGSIKLVLNKKNLGYADGNNLGAKKAKGKYLVFLNNDTLVPPGWLEKPIQKMESDLQIAFLQPKIKWLKNKKFFDYAGGAGGFLDYLGFPFVRGRIFGTIEEDIGQYDDEREIFWASGVALFCQKAIFKKLGGFDTFFFTHGEEEDLCFRAHRLGLKVIYYPHSEVFHLGAYTGGRNMFKRTFFNHRNHLVLLVKNLKLRELVFIFPPRVATDFLAIAYYIFRFKDWKLAASIIAAYGSFIKNLPKTFKTRYKYGIKDFGYPQKHDLVYKESIIWQHFILKKNRWCEIFGKTTVKSKLIKLF